MEEKNQPSPKPEDSTSPSPTSPVAEQPPSRDNTSMPRSRLRRSLEKQSKKTLTLTLIGGICILVLIIIYGQELLINFALLLGRATGKQEEIAKEVTADFIPPPVLDPIYTATNSAKIQLEGTVTEDTVEQVKLYNDGETVDVTQPESNDTFTFKDVSLEEGENIFTVIGLKDQNKSNPSNEVKITYIKDPPDLEIEYPQDGQSFTGESMLQVKGKTEPDVVVKINDFLAITKDDGSFVYSYTLQNGENKIKVTATDKAGNKTEKEIKVNYSQ